MSKVFIVNNTTHDYSTAEKYGEFVKVTDGKVPIFKTNDMIAKMQEGLKDFTEEDYLLISGPALLSILATNVLFKKFNTIKLLVFDAKKQGYIVRHIHHDNL